jgi:hypothetical protein
LASRPSATRRRRREARRRKKANASADQAIYQPVTYTNANKKGPQIIVLPGEIKSNNATFLQKFTRTTSPTSARSRCPPPNFQVLERSNLGPLLNEFTLAYNLGDPQPRASSSAWASSRRPSTS